MPGWTPPDGSLQVDAVNFRPTLEGEAVRLSVSVLMGTRHEQERDVAAYTLREGEKIRVQELTRFGVEPFGVKLVRITPSNVDLPQVISDVTSIEIVTIQANLSTLPSFRVGLRNLSNKNVSALEVKVMQEGRTRLSGMPQGKEGSPLILAGGVSEINEPAATRASATPGGYDPVTPPNQIIQITTAIFEDGSFEGDIESAATFRAFVKGRKIQLRRLVNVFQTALHEDRSDPSSALEKLQNKVSVLGIEVDSTVVQEVRDEFSALTGEPKRELRSAIEVGMSGIRRGALEEIQQFRQSNPNVDANAFYSWLVGEKQRYEAWLSHL